MNANRLLQGKTILIVGAAGRIGRVVLDAVLAAGGRAVALDSDINGLQALAGANAQAEVDFVTVDIADRVAIDCALANAHDRFGAVDGAVNAAYPRNPNYGRHFFDVEYADFYENAGLHLGGYFLFMQSCARYSLEREHAFSLVNLSSIYGSMAPRFDVYAGTSMTMPIEYAAIKAGIEHITSYVNAYMKGRGVAFRANCVSPGGILAGQEQQFLSRYGEYCMSKGMLDAQDVTGAIVFLLSDAACHVVGQNIIVDDGFSI